MTDGRRFGLAAGGLAVLHLALGLLVFELHLFPGGDNAGYLILGDALRSGEGYRDLHLPLTPLHTKYPPLLPAFLAVLGVFGGAGLAKFAMLLVTSAAVWGTAHLGRRWVGEGPGLTAAALLAVNPTLLEYGHYVLSEAPFTLLVVAALGLSLREGRGAAVLAVVCAAGAFATRTAGMALLVALPVAWWLQGRRRPAVWAGLAAAGVMGAWALYQSLAGTGEAGYLTELLLLDPYTPELGRVGPADLVRRAAVNAWEWVARHVPDLLLGPGAADSLPRLALGAVVVLAALAGWASRARRELRAPEVFTVLYIGLVTLWPSSWTDRRFLLPLAPVLLLLATWAAWNLPSRGLPLAWRPWLKWTAPAIVAALGLSWTVRTAPQRLPCFAAHLSTAGAESCQTPGIQSFHAAADWARDNAPPGAIIANRKPRLFFLRSGRRGDVYPFLTDTEAVLRGLEEMGADYVVVDGIYSTTTEYLVPAILEHQSRFEGVYARGSPPTLIFRLLPPSGNAD